MGQISILSLSVELTESSEQDKDLVEVELRLSKLDKSSEEEVASDNISSNILMKLSYTTNIMLHGL